MLSYCINVGLFLCIRSYLELGDPFTYNSPFVYCRVIFVFDVIFLLFSVCLYYRILFIYFLRDFLTLSYDD